MIHRVYTTNSKIIYTSIFEFMMKADWQATKELFVSRREDYIGPNTREQITRISISKLLCHSMLSQWSRKVLKCETSMLVEAKIRMQF
jgi:hypothetical protein